MITGLKKKKIRCSKCKEGIIGPITLIKGKKYCKSCAKKIAVNVGYDDKAHREIYIGKI